MTVFSRMTTNLRPKSDSIRRANSFSCHSRRTWQGASTRRTCRRSSLALSRQRIVVATRLEEAPARRSAAGEARLGGRGPRPGPGVVGFMGLQKFRPRYTAATAGPAGDTHRTAPRATIGGTKSPAAPRSSPTSFSRLTARRSCISSRKAIVSPTSSRAVCAMRWQGQARANRSRTLSRSSARSASSTALVQSVEPFDSLLDRREWGEDFLGGQVERFHPAPAIVSDGIALPEPLGSQSDQRPSELAVDVAVRARRPAAASIRRKAVRRRIRLTTGRRAQPAP